LSESAERNVLREDVCLMRCEDTNGRMRLFLYRCERILCGYYGRFLVWCVARTVKPTTRRRTRDFGPKREKDLLGAVCVQMSSATKNLTKAEY